MLNYIITQSINQSINPKDYHGLIKKDQKIHLKLFVIKHSEPFQINNIWQSRPKGLTMPVNLQHI